MAPCWVAHSRGITLPITLPHAWGMFTNMFRNNNQHTFTHTFIRTQSLHTIVSIQHPGSPKFVSKHSSGHRYAQFLSTQSLHTIISMQNHTHTTMQHYVSRIQCIRHSRVYEYTYSLATFVRQIRIQLSQRQYKQETKPDRIVSTQIRTESSAWSLSHTHVVM